MSTTPAWTLTTVIKDPSCTSVPTEIRWLTIRQYNFHNKADAMRRLGAASAEMEFRRATSEGFFGESAVGADGVRRIWTEGAWLAWDYWNDPDGREARGMYVVRVDQGDGCRGVE